MTTTKQLRGYGRVRSLIVGTLCAVTLIAIAVRYIGVFGTAQRAFDDVIPSERAAMRAMGKHIRAYGVDDSGHVTLLLFAREPLEDTSVLVYLSQLSSLESLNLRDTAIGDQECDVIARCRSLRNINLSGTNVGAEGWTTLRRELSLNTLTGIPFESPSYADQRREDE
jgi:hypothetical protein